MKNNILITVIIGVLSGVCLGYIFWGTKQTQSISSSTMTHKMPDGSIMSNNSMQSAMDGMTNDLLGKTGDSFDRAFLSEMIMHHQGAVEMAQMVIKTSNRPELIKLANNIITAQTGEIKMMQEWQQNWFK